MIPRQKIDYESKILRAKNYTKIIPSQKQGYKNEYLRAKKKPIPKLFQIRNKVTKMKIPALRVALKHFGYIVFESVYVCNKRIK